MIKNESINESNLKSIPQYSDFDYWFYRKNDGGYTVKKLTEAELEFATIYDLTNFSEIADPQIANDIKLDFNKYLERPESAVGRLIDVENMDQNQLISAYEILIAGCAMIRCDRNGSNPDSCTKQIMNCLNWIRTTDFYSAPASTQYHDAEFAGLLKHSLRVVNNIIELIKVKKFDETCSIADAVLVALVHDWCKIGLYEQYMRNTKDNNGNWIQVPAYKRHSPKFPLGHGDTSAYLASRCFRLDMPEYAAVKWHMGEWYCHQSEYNDLQKANETYPLVLLLQFADRLAITNY